MKLGGYLVGYGIEKSNGEKYEIWLDNPIHNTITKHFLNDLLQLDRTNAVTTDIGLTRAWFASPSANYSGVRKGVINFGAVGDGTGSTSVNDTDLKHRITGLSENRKSGTYYNGTYINSSQRLLKLRISYNFTNFDASYSIKELGIYSVVNDIPLLSSRIQLENAINVESGDSFYFIYELNITFSQEEIIYLPSINKYLRKRFKTGIESPSDNSWTTNNYVYGGFAGIGNTGYPNDTYFYRFQYFCAVCKFPYYYTGTEQLSYYSTYYPMSQRIVYPVLNNSINYSFTPDFKQIGSSNYNISWANNSKDYCSRTVLDYVQDSFHRDSIITLNEQWCSDTDIYGFYQNGESYQFGDVIDDVFTPSAWHKPSDTYLKLTFRQSWSTDLLSPTA